MAKKGFHEKPFDEATLTKLELFELYAREWLPVFLNSGARKVVHLYDFFAGPGTDSAGVVGSPLRLLRQVREFLPMAAKSGVRIAVHLFDADKDKIAALNQKIDAHGLRLSTVTIETEACTFEDALLRSRPAISDTAAAKLVLMDQFGVDQVTTDRFLQLASAPTCDFLFFVSSGTFNRFRDHPAIKLKVTRPEDHYQIHVAVMDFYREQLPAGQRFYLSPFSLKRGPNIYGVIFGSAHPRGMDKFLQVAWNKDKVNGEADFDINRENIRPGQGMLPMLELQPSKVTAFEADLEAQIRSGAVIDEGDVVQICFDHGVRRQHAEPVLNRLKTEGVIELTFRVPDIDRLSKPRAIRLVR